MRAAIAFLLAHAFLMIPPVSYAQDAAVLDLLKKNASLKFAPTTVQQAIDASYFQLRQLKSISLAASISSTAANALLNSELKSLDPSFSDAKVQFSDQSADITFSYNSNISIPAVGSVRIGALLRGRLSPTVEVISDQTTTDFDVSFAVASLEVQKINVFRGKDPLSGFASEVAAAAANAILLPAQAYLNRIRLRMPSTMSGQIDVRPANKGGAKIALEPRKIGAKLKIAAVTYLMNDGKLTAAAQEGGQLNSVSPKPTNVPFAKLRDDFIQQLKTSKADWLFDGQMAGYVNRDLLNRMTSATFGSGPICMNFVLDERVMPFATKLKLPAEDSIDCTPTRDCTPTKDCSQNMECSQNESCSACIVRNPFGGCSIRGNDPLCEARKVANKASCELEKSRRKGQCEADKAANKLSCEAAKTATKQGCEALKDGYKRLRATGSDFASVDSKDLVLSGNANVCLRNIAFDAAAFRLTAKLTAVAHAHATGHIKFTPLNVVGHAACFAPYEKSLNLDAEVPSQDLEIDTTARFVDDSTQATITARIANPIHIRFPFRAIAAKLFTDPSFTLTCPIPGVASGLRAATPDNWWPKQARGEIERDLPDFIFELDLVSRPTKVGDFTVKGALRQNVQAIGGVFTLIPPKGPNSGS